MQDKGDKGWTLANCWLTALEETARDFHGANPRPICERGYEHVTVRWIQALEEQYGITIPKANSILGAVENYIEANVEAGLFRDSSQFELKQINPHRLELIIMECPYRKGCELLIEGGIPIRDLTCARIGCFRVAVETLAGISCKYEVSAFRPDGFCEGYIERR